MSLENNNENLSNEIGNGLGLDVGDNSGQKVENKVVEKIDKIFKENYTKSFLKVFLFKKFFLFLFFSIFLIISLNYIKNTLLENTTLFQKIQNDIYTINPLSLQERERMFCSKGFNLDKFIIYLADKEMLYFQKSDKDKYKLYYPSFIKDIEKMSENDGDVKFCLNYYRDYWNVLEKSKDMVSLKGDKLAFIFNKVKRYKLGTNGNFVDYKFIPDKQNKGVYYLIIYGYKYDGYYYKLNKMIRIVVKNGKFYYYIKENGKFFPIGKWAEFYKNNYTDKTLKLIATMLKIIQNKEMRVKFFKNSYDIGYIFLKTN